MRELDEPKTGKPVGIVLPPILRRKRNLIQRMIARRAYELFELRGRIPGHPREDWAQAESELLYPCGIDVRDVPEAIIVQADLPGSFTPDQLRVSIETRQVMIHGERRISMICGRSDKTHTIHTEQRTQRIFRVYDLPMDVDATTATATLLGNTLEIWLPKVFTAGEHEPSTSSVALL